MEITALTVQGQGRAADGTLVPRTLPGEVVEVDGGLRILSPSPDRVAAPCRHFRSCGGCAMQHASDAFVADWKVAVVERALAAQGLAPGIEGIRTSPPRSRRRAKFSGRRTKKGATVGFHAPRSDTIVDVPDCQLVLPEIRALLPALEEITALAATRKGEIALTVTASAAGADVRIDAPRPPEPRITESLAILAGRLGLARLSWGDDVLAEAAPPAQVFGNVRVVPPPGAFLQATAEGEAALREVVLAGTTGAARVADLFAGCGTFALPLAARAEVHAVEGEPDMVRALERGWRAAPGLRRVTCEARDLFRRPLLPEELKGFDAVVLDPPRAGAAAQCAALARSNVDRIVMVSCDPATFARDLRVLDEAGFDAGPVRVVDQFRWSAHVEVATRLTRR